MRSLILLFFALLFAGQAARAENADIPVYQKLCDGGDAFYCQALGNIYNEGRDTPVNKAKAASVFVKACSGQASVAFTAPASNFWRSSMTSSIFRKLKPARWSCILRHLTYRN